MRQGRGSESFTPQHMATPPSDEVFNKESCFVEATHISHSWQLDIIVLEPLIFIIGRLILASVIQRILGTLREETLGPLLLVLVGGPPCPVRLFLRGSYLPFFLGILLLLSLALPLAFQ